MKRLALVALGFVALAGCASSPGGPMGGPGGPGGPREPMPGLFVSPFGELFFSEPGQPWPVVDWFAGADTDSDSRITLEEFTADGARYFQTLDRNRDGRLTSEEIAVYEEALAAARARLPGAQSREQRPGVRLQGFRSDLNLGLAEPAPQQQGRRRPERAPTGPLGYGAVATAGFFNYPQPVKAADTDMNQTITAQEWEQATGRWFIALDQNRDGALTLAELPRTPLQQLMERERR
ncbi:hypothetical protein [Brevundimonas sp.]